MPPIFIMTETTVAQKSLSGLDYAGMEHLHAHSFFKGNVNGGELSQNFFNTKLLRYTMKASGQHVLLI